MCDCSCPYNADGGDMRAGLGAEPTQSEIGPFKTFYCESLKNKTSSTIQLPAVRLWIKCLVKRAL